MEQHLKEMISDLYENTELTIDAIAKKIDSTYKPVFSYIAKTYSKDIRKKRKSKTYRNSKLGKKNPMLGKQSPNYKGECSDGKGYLTVFKPEWFTGRPCSQRVFVHTITMCKALGVTELPSCFVVHHIDRNPLNNDINNLCLLTNSGHGKLHQCLKHGMPK